MDIENQMQEEMAASVSQEDEDILLPEGYQEGDDIFADTEEEPEKAVPNLDTPQAENVPNSDTEKKEEAVPDSDTTQEDKSQEETLKFTDTLGGMSREVEVKREELPALYRNAQTAGFVTRHSFEQDGRARALGYESVDDLLAKVRTEKVEAEKARLMEGDVHEEVALYMANQKYPQFAQKPQESPRNGAAATQQTQQSTRNFPGEISELIAAFPDLKGKQLPEEVTTAAVSGTNLLNAYRDYLHKRDSEALAAAQKELQIMRQNAAAAEKAPVGSITTGGSADSKPQDPFLAGFMSDV